VSPTEKKIAAVLAVVLVAMIAVYFATQPKPGSAAGPLSPEAAAAAGTQSSAVACAPTAGGGGAATTQEFGEAGAKLEIIAVLPLAIGCHRATEAEVKKAYEKHPDDIHLVVVDLMGPDAAKYREKVGVGWMAVSINGKTTFDLDGRPVKLEQMENGTYRPADILPIIEAELSKPG
jgi:hypothetical protein